VSCRISGDLPTGSTWERSTSVQQFEARKSEWREKKSTEISEKGNDRAGMTDLRLNNGIAEKWDDCFLDMDENTCAVMMERKENLRPCETMLSGR
jgi:hypothetical protein